jgi:hypothetical protein
MTFSLFTVKAVVYETVYHGYDNIYFYCSYSVCHQFIIAIRHFRCLRYVAIISLAKGCIQALHVASGLRTVLSRGILAIYHNPLGLIALVYSRSDSYSTTTV